MKEFEDNYIIGIACIQTTTLNIIFMAKKQFI